MIIEFFIDSCMLIYEDHIENYQREQHCGDF